MNPPSHNFQSLLCLHPASHCHLALPSTLLLIVTLTTHLLLPIFEVHQEDDLWAHDLLPVELHKLKQYLDHYNSICHLITFNKIIKDWVVWDRYVLVSDTYLIYIFLWQASQCPQNKAWSPHSCSSKWISQHSKLHSTILPSCAQHLAHNKGM